MVDIGLGKFIGFVKVIKFVLWVDFENCKCVLILVFIVKFVDEIYVNVIKFLGKDVFVGVWIIYYCFLYYN